MDKHTRAQPGAGIRGTRRKIAKFRMKGERNELPELGIHCFDSGVGIFQIEPRPHAVQPQMVLFIYHDTNLVLHEQRRTRARTRLALQPRQLLADEMAFV